MTQNELRAAAERLRPHLEDWRLYPYPTAPHDMATLARAYLAEHPTGDGGGPFDAEGFVKRCYVAGWLHGLHGSPDDATAESGLSEFAAELRPHLRRPA